MAKNSYKSHSSLVSTHAAVQEAERLEILRNYQILDTPREQAFDDLAKLTAYICDTPIALISFIGADRQSVKAQVGGENLHDLPRNIAFCSYAMLSEDLLEVEDAAQDANFQYNPLVVGKQKIRFYVGVPLLTPEGYPLGSLCAIDTAPRRLNEQQREALRILAREVVAHLELRRARLQLEKERQQMLEMLRPAIDDSTKTVAEEQHTEIFVRQEQKLVRVATADITYVEALGDYVNIYTERERLTVYSTMKELENRLPSRDFARIHRKYIVCLGRIIAIETDTALFETNKATTLSLPIGSSYKAGLLNRLNLI
ncbi:GAF domain-containing DNA-binding protein [Hymenobacter aerilatus]|uniref:GAF domain-containing DNA-binding protein n=1 Tax=Hymenobacter aerilatus TaxID=2932251 RepID=A0A8T9SZG5_9BACT|nr:GAF domain-containing DNA-binding protein [Hymenobacter aerilatus]UOR05226.1 GAF domain-containing DNA-binding protein [Hymenobacter aerilatus]